jgi:hypothetical protein
MIRFCHNFFLLIGDLIVDRYLMFFIRKEKIKIKDSTI